MIPDLSALAAKVVPETSQCWADGPTVIGEIVPCRKPAVSPVGLCADHHEEIVP